MKSTKKITFYLIMFCILLPMAALAKQINCIEATTAGNSFLQEYVGLYGSWGGDKNPQVSECKEFKKDNIVLGYYLPVSSKGYIILNQFTQLMPFAAYSETSNLNPMANDGFAGLLKDNMELTIQFLKKKYSSLESLPEEGIAPTINKDDWNFYLKKGAKPVKESSNFFAPLLFQSTAQEKNFSSLNSDMVIADPAMSVSWHQNTPFNNYCPYGDSGRTVVGCVATAAAQIMKYWNYPNAGIGSHSYYWSGDTSCDGSTAGSTLFADFSDTYDWSNMLNDYSEGYTTNQANAAAELSYEVGVAFEMDYGRCGSGATTSDAQNIFPDNFNYADTTNVQYRSGKDNIQWFNLIREEFDNYLPRPIQYRIYRSTWGGHSIVCDGYDSNYSTIHLNYGWDDSHNAWYALDNLYCGTIACPANEQYMVRGIQPKNRMYLYLKAASNNQLWYGVDFPSVSMTYTTGFNGYSSHAPSMAVFNNRQYIAVKGSSNQNVYIMSKDGMSNWTNWTTVPNVSTDVSPLIVTYNNRLFMFLKGIDNKIYYNSIDTSGTWGSSWSSIPGWTSNYQPAAAVYGDKLYVFVRGNNSKIYFSSLSDTNSWGTTYSLSTGSTDKVPAVVRYKSGLTEYLYLFVKGNGANETVYYITSSSPTSAWSSWSSLGGITPSAPSAAVRPEDNSLYVAVRGSNNAIYYKKYNGSSWTGWTSVTGLTSDTPTLNTYYYFNP